MRLERPALPALPSPSAARGSRRAGGAGPTPGPLRLSAGWPSAAAVPLTADPRQCLAHARGRPVPPGQPSEPHRAFPRPQRCRNSNLPPRAPGRLRTAAVPRARPRYLSAMGRPRAALGWAGLGSARLGWTQPASAPHRAPRPTRRRARPASSAQRAQWEAAGGAGRGGAALARAR